MKSSTPPSAIRQLTEHMVSSGRHLCRAVISLRPLSAVRQLKLHLQLPFLLHYLYPMKSLALTADERSSLLAVVTAASPRVLALSRLLPATQREAFFVLFAWLYQAHEITKLQDGDPKKTLRAYKEELLTVWNGNSTRHLITLLFVRLAQEYKLSKGDCLDFLFALEKAQHKNPFSNRRELDAWLSHTAGFIGESLANISEASTEERKTFRRVALLLGMSFILRSVGRDWRLYNRVLLPLSLLEQYELERDQLWNRRHTWQWHELIHDEVERLLTEKHEIHAQLSSQPRNAATFLQVLLELETWTLKRLRKQPILCWNILPLKPSKAQFLSTVSWWTWKLRGMPKALKSIQTGKRLLQRNQQLLKRT